MPAVSNFADVQSKLTREVWIITAAHKDRRSGLTATWVSPVSLDPTQPILLAALSANHFTTELVRGSRAFAAHLLRPDQIELAWNFAHDSGRERDKFAGLELLPTKPSVKSPVLRDCLACLDCHVITFHQAGERLFVWADVVAVKTNSAEMPLVDRDFFAALSEEQKQHLAARRSADMIIQSPLHQKWRLESLLKLG